MRGILIPAVSSAVCILMANSFVIPWSVVFRIGVCLEARSFSRFEVQSPGRYSFPPHFTPAIAHPASSLFSPSTCVLFSNNILASLVTHPNLVYPAGLNIYSRAHAKRLFGRRLIFGIRNCKCTSADQMGRKAVMGVGRVMCVSAPVLISYDFKEGGKMSVDEKRNREAYGPSAHEKT